MATAGNVAPDRLAQLEEQLSGMLRAASEEVEHVECFDDEQRSEMYTILRALRADTELDRALVDLVARQWAPGRAHA